MEMLKTYNPGTGERAEEHKRVMCAEGKSEAVGQIATKNLELSSLRGKPKRTMAENLAVQHPLSQLKKLAALGKLVASVGHELNNPIMGSLNYVQYCLRRTEQDDPRHSRLTKAVRELARCQRVLDALRSHSYGSGGE